jgi:Fur family zinc uptake transcriptional regulator
MVARCHHDSLHGLAPDALAKAMHDAETRCLAQGLRWTAPRRRVFELLLRQGAPVKAYDLMAVYGEGDEGAAKPTTVYRALEFLESLQLAHRIPSLNAYVACGHASGEHTAAFMICDCCGGTQEFQPALDKIALRTASDQDFAIKSVALEVRGLCHACRQAA